MAIQTNKKGKASLLFGMLLLSFLVVISGFTACQKTAEESAEGREEEAAEGTLSFEGTVKVVLGKYMFIPQASGFDIVIQGNLDSGEVEGLIDKEVRVKGKLSPDKPSIMVADTLEEKGPAGNWTKIFTRTEDVVLEDYLDQYMREEYVALDGLSYDKKDLWENNQKVKVYGSLETSDNGDAIVVIDEEGKQIGKVLVDAYTDYARYYLKKLRLFDKFWFYLNVKDTVDWDQRRRTREMFHADMVYAGLY
jgi:hypothetical protein